MVSAGCWPTCPGSSRELSLTQCVSFFIFLCLYLKPRSYPSAVFVLPANLTTFAFVIRVQMCFMIEQLLRTAAPPPRGVHQACLCKLSCRLFFFFFQKHVWVCFCVYPAGSWCLRIIGSLYKNVPKYTAAETASVNPTKLPALAAQATINNKKPAPTSPKPCLPGAVCAHTLAFPLSQSKMIESLLGITAHL